MPAVHLSGVNIYHEELGSGEALLRTTERIPGARQETLERDGHGVPVEYPQEVNDAQPAFLVEQPATVGR